jgi:hypothetical protein
LVHPDGNVVAVEVTVKVNVAVRVKLPLVPVMVSG